MALTLRLYPPQTPGKNTMVANGRTYTCALGATIDVAANDAAILLANGWVLIQATGTTAQRPAGTAQGSLDGSSVGPGFDFYDQTLSKTICWVGSNWADPATGAAV